MESRTEVGGIRGRERRADQDQPGKFLLSKNIFFGTSRIIIVSVMLVKLLLPKICLCYFFTDAVNSVRFDREMCSGF